MSLIIVVMALVLILALLFEIWILSCIVDRLGEQIEEARKNRRE